MSETIEQSDIVMDVQEPMDTGNAMSEAELMAALGLTSDVEISEKWEVKADKAKEEKAEEDAMLASTLAALGLTEASATESEEVWERKTERERNMEEAAKAKEHTILSALGLSESLDIQEKWEIKAESTIHEEQVMSTEVLQALGLDNVDSVGFEKWEIKADIEHQETHEMMAATLAALGLDSANLDDNQEAWEKKTDREKAELEQELRTIQESLGIVSQEYSETEYWEKKVEFQRLEDLEDQQGI